MWPETKPIKVNLSKFDVIEIIEVSDPHFGNECFDQSRWNRLCEYILAEPNRFVIWAGDLMENAIPGSKSNPLTQIMTPHEQREYVVAMFKMFKDRTLAIVDGNHEYNRSTKAAGLYPLYDAACITGLEDRYRSSYAILDVKVGNKARGRKGEANTFVGYICHKTKKMKNFAATDFLEGFDFVVGAHDHEPEDHPRAHLCYDRQKSIVSFKSVEHIDNGANLLFGGYAAQGGARPKSMKMYKIICYGDRDKSIQTLGYYI